MTYDQTITLTTLISSAQGISFAERSKLDVWHSLLEPLEFSKAHLALKKLLRTETNLITPGHIIKACQEIGEPDCGNAYAVLDKALYDFGFYRAEEALACIKEQDSVVYEIVTNIGFYNICRSDPVYFRPAFEKLYAEIKKARRVDASLPGSLKKALAEFKTGLERRLTVGEDGADDE